MLAHLDSSAEFLLIGSRFFTGGRLILAQPNAASEKKTRKTRKEKQKEQKAKYEEKKVSGPNLQPIAPGTMVEGNIVIAGDVFLTVNLTTGLDSASKCSRIWSQSKIRLFTDPFYRFCTIAEMNEAPNIEVTCFIVVLKCQSEQVHSKVSVSIWTSAFKSLKVSINNLWAH